MKRKQASKLRRSNSDPTTGKAKVLRDRLQCWMCSPNISFHNLSSNLEHMRKFHAEWIASDSKKALAELSERTAGSLVIGCKYCDMPYPAGNCLESHEMECDFNLTVENSEESRKSTTSANSSDESEKDEDNNVKKKDKKGKRKDKKEKGKRRRK